MWADLKDTCSWIWLRRYWKPGTRSTTKVWKLGGSRFRRTKDIGPYKCGTGRRLRQAKPSGLAAQGAKIDDGWIKNRGKGKDEEYGEGKDAEESRERSRGQEAALKEYCRGKLQTTIYVLRKEAGLVKSSQARPREFLFPLYLASFPHHFTIRSSLPPSTLLVPYNFRTPAFAMVKKLGRHQQH